VVDLVPCQTFPGTGAGPITGITAGNGLSGGGTSGNHDRRGRRPFPDWFETLNTGFRYKLMVIGQFAQSIVSSESHGNRFEIKTSAPKVKVSW
jgi:hypothetical protein